MKRLLILIFVFFLAGCQANMITNTTTKPVTNEVTWSTDPADYINGIHISTYWSIFEDSSNHYGFVDSNGVIRIPFIYDYAYLFKNETAIVKEDGNYGVINYYGDYIFNPVFYKIEGLNNNKFFEVFTDPDTAYLYDNHGKLISDNQDISNYYSSLNDSDLVRFVKDGSWGLMDNTGNILTKTLYDKIGLMYDGMMKVEKDGLWGYIDARGNPICDIIYENAWNFANNFGSVQKADDHLWYPIDASGVIRNKPSEMHYSFSTSGYSLYEINSLIGVINTVGVITVHPDYTPKNMLQNWVVSFNSVFTNGTRDVILGSDGTIKYSTDIATIVSFYDGAIIIRNHADNMVMAIDYQGNVLVNQGINSLVFRIDVSGDPIISEVLPEITPGVNKYNIYDIYGNKLNSDPLSIDMVMFNNTREVYLTKDSGLKLDAFGGSTLFDIDADGGLLLNNSIVVFKDGLYGMVDYNGNVLLPIQYKSIQNAEIIYLYTHKMQFQNKVGTQF